MNFGKPAEMLQYLKASDNGEPTQPWQEAGAVTRIRKDSWAERAPAGAAAFSSRRPEDCSGDGHGEEWGCGEEERREINPPVSLSSNHIS